MWDLLLFLYICNSKTTLKWQIHSYLQRAMGIFNTLPHRKSSHVTTISALLNKGLFPWDYMCASSISAAITVLHTAQLQPSRSNKNWFGWPETALDTEHEEEAFGMKSSDQGCQWQQETDLRVNWPQHKWKENSKTWQWEIGLQTNPTICQINLNTRAKRSTKVTLSPALAGKCWWWETSCSWSFLVALGHVMKTKVMLTLTLAIAKITLSTRPLQPTSAAPGLCWDG